MLPRPVPPIYAGKYRMLDLYVPSPRVKVAVSDTRDGAGSDSSASSGHSMLSADSGGGGGGGAAGDVAGDVDGRHGGRPVIVFVPGGGWRQHGRLAPLGLYVGMGHSLAKRGFIVAITSYRLRGITLANYLPLAAIITLVLTAVLVLPVGFTTGWRLSAVIPAGL